MNSLLLQPAEFLEDLSAFTDDLLVMPTISVIDDAFATTPMPSIPPAFLANLVNSEEDVYTSFEEAISERVLAMQRQLQYTQSRINPYLQPAINQMPSGIGHFHPGRRQASPLPSTDPHSGTMSEGRGDACLRPVTYRPVTFNPVILAALSLALVLLGFDLMGLLVLFAH